MRGQTGPWLVSTWMSSLRATTPYAALHSATPSPDDPTATEVTGGWYSRKAFAWDALDETAAANAAAVKWNGTPGVTLAGLAIYTTSTGSSLMLWCPVVPLVTVPVGGNIMIGAHEIYVEIV